MKIIVLLTLGFFWNVCLADEKVELQTLVPEHPFASCAACHGIHGEGKKELMAPRLLGQHRGYLENQIKAFKEGWRGHQKENIPAFTMANAIKGMDDQALKKAIDYVTSLEHREPAHRLFGDRWRGEHLYQRGCAICHGDKGEGSTQYNMAKLNMQHGWYLEKQLENFRKDQRGIHSQDQSGKTMNFYAKLLPDDQAVQDVVAFITYTSRLLYRQEATKDLSN